MVSIFTTYYILQNSLTFLLSTFLSVKLDFLTWKLYLPLIWVASFDERVCINDRIDCTYLKGKLKSLINKYNYQIYTMRGRKSLPSNVFKAYVKVSFGKKLLHQKVNIFPFTLHKLQEGVF
jgi:hypothetical protein